MPVIAGPIVSVTVRKTRCEEGPLFNVDVLAITNGTISDWDDAAIYTADNGGELLTGGVSQPIAFSSARTAAV